MARISFIFQLFSFLISLSCGNGKAQGDVLPIQFFKTPKGIETWLVEDHTSPVVSVILSFDKAIPSSPYTPLSLLFRDSLLSGAGILTPLEMQRFRNGTPARWAVQTGISKNNILIKTTKEGLHPTLKLWAKLVNHPEFEKANLSFIKQKTQNTLTEWEEDLGLVNFLKLLETIFPNASFENNFTDVKSKLDAVTAEKLLAETLDNFLAYSPKVVVVGDAYKGDVVKLLDETFGSLKFTLPSSSHDLKPTWTSKDVLIEKDIPQSLVDFAQPGLSPIHKDYPKFLLLQYILTGRFYDELRTKRGYIYSISFNESHYKNIDLLRGSFACECGLTQKVINFVRYEWKKLKDFGISQQELSDSKKAFKRTKVLSLTSTEAVANEYIEALEYGLGPDSANDLIKDTEKVTLDQMNQFMQDALKPESLTCVLIGPSAKSPK